LIDNAGGSVKLAIVMHALGVDRDEAERRMEWGDGVVRRVIGGEPPPVE
jgi:N-acetylmuramic acid 6-phosphate (MurNAc-6-P) etherase